MSKIAFTITINREDLPEVITVGDHRLLNPVATSELAHSHIGPKQLIVGYWGEPEGDPFPDFLAVRDDEYADAQAWMSAYMVAFAPISQWCRVWRASELAHLNRIGDTPTLGRRMGAWVGAIIAEYGSQGTPNLKEVSGAAALTTPTYSAARALAVWGDFDRFDDLLKRHEATMTRHRDVGRPLTTEHLLPLWYVLAGARWQTKPSVDSRALDPIKQIIDYLDHETEIGQDQIADLAKRLGSQLGLPEIHRCAVGPQGSRVEALDLLGGRLMSGPRSAATNAIMGFSASLIDPGTPVLPELLRRYSQVLPAAALWAGAFAGMWFPVRVLSEHAGFGRLIAKELLAQSDLFTKPAADISFDELSRWTGRGFEGRFPFRGLMLRSIFVEIFPGVTIPIPSSRSDALRQEAPISSNAAVKQQALNLDSPGAAERAIRKSGREVAEQTPTMRSLLLRMDKLEKGLEDLMRKGSKSSSRTSASRAEKSGS